MRTEQISKCCEPQLKLRVMLWPCKTSLSPLVIYITDHSKAKLLWWFLLFCILLWNFCSVSTLRILSEFRVSELPTIGKVAAHSAYNMRP